MGLFDASTALLFVRFANYRRPGEDEIAPFEARIGMLAPYWVAEKRPDIAEATALATIVRALDDYFTQSMFDKLKEVRANLPEGEQR